MPKNRFAERITEPGAEYHTRIRTPLGKTIALRRPRDADLIVEAVTRPPKELVRLQRRVDDLQFELDTAQDELSHANWELDAARGPGVSSDSVCHDIRREVTN